MDYGSYATSYLKVYINTNLPLDKLDDPGLPDYEKRVFIHEYTHFFQNIMGGFGHRHVWQTFDRLRQLMSEQRTNGSPKLKIPLESPERTRQDGFLRTRMATQGSYEVVAEMDDATTTITGHTEYADATFEKLNSGTGPVFLKLRLRDGVGNEMDYCFGRSAIAEAMARLMETKFYVVDPVPNFPYHACRMLAKYLGTDLLDNDELLFALCDVCLLWQFPGNAFYRIVIDLIEKKKIPKTGEEMFDYGLNYMDRQRWPLWNEFEKSMNGAVATVGSFFAHPAFNETKEWFIYLLAHGHGLRMARPHFLIELYKEPVPFKGTWDEAVARFGTPELHTTSNKVRHFNAPLDLKTTEHNIHAFFLLAGLEVERTLLYGESTCRLLEFCKHSKNGLVTDERCENAPWLRAKDEETCSYGAIWASQGLQDKVVEISG